MSKNKVVRKCPRCGKRFQLGYNGAATVGGKALVCDACQGNKRDEYGCVIRSFETEPKYMTELKKAGLA